jgi:hypothetical protein
MPLIPVPASLLCYSSSLFFSFLLLPWCWWPHLSSCAPSPVFTFGTKPNGKSCRGILNLVDLAGSERLKRSKVTGAEADEAKAINMSLTALGNVVEALKNKQKHIPYRDSALTQVLAPGLGGGAKTAFIIQLSPAEINAEESGSTLKFAERLRGVELGASKKS